MTVDLREMFTQALTHDPYIDEFVDQRAYQYNAIPAEVILPYLMLKFGNEAPEPRWRTGPTRRTLAIWAYDGLGDYNRIDTILERAKAVIQALPSVEQFLEARFMETGPDVDDPALGVILRYARYQITTTV